MAKQSAITSFLLEQAPKRVEELSPESPNNLNSCSFKMATFSEKIQTNQPNTHRHTHDNKMIFYLDLNLHK